MHDMITPRIKIGKNEIGFQAGINQVKVPPKFNDDGVTPDPDDADFNHLKRKHKTVDLSPIAKKKPDINELRFHICQLLQNLYQNTQSKIFIQLLLRHYIQDKISLTITFSYSIK
jgi:hypothetical protein